jgi:hypothetical protein
MASVIFEISKKTPFEELAEKLSPLSPAFAKDSFQEGKPLSLQTFLNDTLSCLPQILASPNAQLIETFALIGYIFQTSSAFPSLISALSECESSAATLQALAFLYGLADGTGAKFSVFRAIAGLVARNLALMPLIQPHLLKIEDFMKSWPAVPTSEMVELTETLLVLGVPEAIKVRLMFSLLGSTDLDTPTTERLVAKLFHIGYDFDIERLTKAAAFSKASEILRKLVNSLGKSSITELLAFWEEHKSVLAEKGFEKDSVVQVARVAGLVGMMKEEKCVRFAQVAEKLSVREEEVDYWVVRAVSNRMVNGKIDAIRKEIIREDSGVRANKGNAIAMLNKFQKLNR